jgi:hypothetical protein
VILHGFMLHLNRSILLSNEVKFRFVLNPQTPDYEIINFFLILVQSWLCYDGLVLIQGLGIRVMMYDATFNNISAISLAVSFIGGGDRNTRKKSTLPTMVYFELWGLLRVSSVNNFNVNVCYILTPTMSRSISTVLLVLFKTRSHRVNSFY